MTGRRRIALVASAAAGVALLAGCNGSFQGGGTMAGVNGGKAQIQFKVLCNTKTQRVSGQLMYMDRSAGLLLLGAPTSYPGGSLSTLARTQTSHLVVHTQSTTEASNDDYSCDNNTEYGDYLGSYVSLSPRGAGSFEFILSPDEECATGFDAELDLTSGPAAGYDNEQCLATGSVTPIND